jgi:N-acyl-phosphatidylethanolamine-hydrolysing phospholipase D
MINSFRFLYICTILLFLFSASSCFAMRLFQKDWEWRPDVKKIESFPEEDFLVWLGHSTFLIKLSGYVFYTDPVIFDKVVIIKRQIKFPVELEKLPPPHFILISHNHYDHMDIPSLNFLSEKSKKNGINPYIFVPQNASIYLKNESYKVVELKWGDRYKVRDGFEILAVRVKHFSGRNLFDWNFSKWNGYLVVSDGVKIFFGGDTAYLKLPRFEPDIALLPIGAYLPRWFMKRNHVSPCEAVKMAYDIGAKIMIPMHYGTFKQGLDTPEQAIYEMKECAKKFGVKTLIPSPGEIILLEDLRRMEK